MKRKFLLHPSVMVAKLGVISDHLKNSKFCDDNIVKVDAEIQQVADFFDCNYNQAILLSSLVYLHMNGTSLTTEELSDYFKCNPLDILSLWNDFEELADKKLVNIETNRGGRKHLQIRQKVIDALVKSDKSLLNKKQSIETLYDFLDWYDKLVQERDCSDISTNEFFSELNKCLNENGNLEIIKNILGLKISIEEVFILLFIVKETVESGFKREVYFDVDRISSKVINDFITRMKIRRKFASGDTTLVKEGFLKCSEREYRGSSFDFCLTEKGKVAFIGKEIEDEIKEKEKFSPSFGTLILPEKCDEKKLFYNPKEGDLVSELSSIIS